MKMLSKFFLKQIFPSLKTSLTRKQVLKLNATATQEISTSSNIVKLKEINKNKFNLKC